VNVLQGGDEAQLRRMGCRARERVLDEHSSARRAEQFENYVASVASTRTPLRAPILASATRAQSRALQSGVQP
jgi:hypothetical protein